MEEIANNEHHENSLFYGLAPTDYAKVCFEISRSSVGKLEAMIERAWIGNVASYIANLENSVRFLTKKLEEDETKTDA